VIYVVLADRGLFRKRTVIAGLVIPFLMIVPWMVWNYRVYGAELFLANAEITHLISKVGQTLKDYWWAILVAAGAALLCVTIKPRVPESLIQRSASWKAPVIWALTSIVSLSLLAITWPSLINALNWSHVPEAGWSMGMFAAAPWHFYIGRLIEMSPFYILSFAGLVLLAADPVKRKEYLFIYTAVILILGLYIFWGNFQSRYIAAVTVPLVVMAARAMDHILERSARAVKPMRYALIAGLAIFAVCAIAKTLNMDIILAMPNNVCYF
ncbi:MAG: hypothetical protein PHW14_06400, partial [Candidatus Omnitrophica bacterium]|nr:hypothetical protein [Candidatus Omnitrophota bacterium]